MTAVAQHTKAGYSMRRGPPACTKCSIIILLISGATYFAECQAQIPGLARPAGGATVPAGIPAAVQPTAGSTAPAAKPPGVPDPAPAAVAPNNVVTPAATAPGAAGTAPGIPGIAVATPAVVPPGIGSQPPNQPALQPPGVPAATPGAVTNPAAGLLNPAGGAASPGPTTPGGVVNPVTSGPGTAGVPGPGGPGTAVVSGPGGPGAAGILGPGGPVTPEAAQTVPGALVPSPAVAAATAAGVPGASPAVGPAVPGAGPGQTTSVLGDGVLPSLGPVVITPTATTVRSSYTWAVSKRFSDQSKTLALSIPATTGTGTANYQLTVTKSLATQTVTVSGTFTVVGAGNFQTPTLTFAPAPAAAPTGSVSCMPANTAPSTCTFAQTWSDSSIAAAAGGVLTVSIGSSTQTAPYNFAGVTGGTTGNCAVVSDNFAAGSLTGTNMQMTGNYPPSGLQICDIGDKLYEYAVVFSNMQAAWCAAPLTAVNTATVTPTDGGAPIADTATVTIQVTGCDGAAATATATAVSGASALTVSNLQTVVVNTYTWVLENTGGGTGLTTTPSEELTIPFTTTATQTLQSSSGWVGGSVSITNTAVATITLTSFLIDLGSGPVAQPVTQCQTTSVAVGASTSCSFNVTAANAPAAGSVTASVEYTPSGGSAATMTSTATPYSFTAAATYNLGSQATLYLSIDASSITTAPGVWGSNTGQQTSSSLVRLSPPDQAPPLSPPGITVSQSTSYSYNLVISKLLTCLDSRSLTNTATLTPSGGQATSKTAGATFSVTGCNVLPTVSLSDIRTFAAVTWSWSLTKTANPTQVQIPVGGAGSTQYNVQLTRTRSTGNYAMAGTLRIVNPATFPMYISSVTLMSTSGTFGALPPACLGGSNVGGSTISGITGPGWGRRRLLGLPAVRKLLQWATGNQWAAPTTVANPWNTAVPATGATSSFMIAAGAQIECLFNITAGTGAAPQGQVYAQATTTSSYVTSTGNTAISSNVPVDFTAPTQQWDIGGCVTFSDNAVTQGSAGAWAPQLSGLPQQQRICDSRTFPYSGTINAVPMTGAMCNQPVTITNTATAVPDGGAATATATASVQVMATGCTGSSPLPPVAPLIVPSPAVDMVARSQQSSNALVPTVQQPLKIEAVGNYEWVTSITSNVDAAGRLSIPYSTSKAVQYTITAGRSPAFTYYVSGMITVTNQNTQPVSATSVSAQLPSGYVLAVCSQDGRFPVVVSAGGSVQCAFNATLTDATIAQGSVTAAAVSTFGTSTSALALPYTLEPPKSAQDSCAVLSDSISSRPVMATDSLLLTGNKPFSPDATPVCSDTSYNVTARFGPFDASGCNMYMVTAEAAATIMPSDNTAAAVTGGSSSTARNTLQLYVEGCPATAQSVNTVQVLVLPPVGRTVPSVRWSADTQSEWLTTMKYTDSKLLTYNVTWTRMDALDSRLSGTLVITNPTAAPVSIKSAAVVAQFSESGGKPAAAAATATAAGATAGGAPAQGWSSTPPAIDVQCKETTLAPRASVNCTYTGTIPGGGPGTLVAEVQLTGGRIVGSPATPINLPGRTSRSGSTSSELGETQSCADITTGLFLSTLLVTPNRTLSNSAQQVKACSSGKQQVSLMLGPFTEESCGSYTVVLTTRVRTPDSSGQEPFASLGVAKVVVAGCPLSETPKPDTIIEGTNVSNIARYSWRVSTSSDNTDPVTVRQGATSDVVVAVDVVRDRRYSKSVALEGQVQVVAQGTKDVTVSSVQAAVLKRLGEFQVVTATCPSSSLTTDGLITVPARPNKLLCSFSVSDLPPMDGAVTSLVYPSESSLAALPAMPALYKVAGASRVPVGDCASLATSMALRGANATSAVEGQPASTASQALPAQPICSDLSTSFDLTFGPFGASQCGRYRFAGSVTATPAAAPAGVEGLELARPAKADLVFGVDVTGCPGSARNAGQRAVASNLRGV